MSKLKRIHEKLEELKNWLRERDRKIEQLEEEKAKDQKSITYWQGVATNHATTLQALQARLMKYEGTPANRRGDNGEIDHFAHYIDRERADLPLGDYTDDELANAIFIHYDMVPSVEDMLSGKAKMPIVYMTAGKERIRWLSRKLIEALGLNKDATPKVPAEV